MRSNLDIFSDAQAITGDALSTNYVDVGKFAGQGEPIPIRVKVMEDFNNLDSLHVSVFECDTTGGTYTEVLSTPEVPLASLTQGYEFVIQYLPKVSDRYIKLKYVTTGAAEPTQGKITAEIVSGKDFPYKDGLYFSPRNSSGAEATA